MIDCFAKISKKGIWAIFLVMLMLISSYPYVFRQLVTLPNMLSVYLIGVFLLVISLFLTRVKKTSVYGLKIICIIQIFTWIIYYIIHSDTSYLTRIFFVILSYIVIVCLDNIAGILNWIKVSNIFITLQAVLSLIALVLIILGVLQPIAEAIQIDGRPFFFYGISTSNVSYGGINRMSGYFDEPGALAFWGIYALLFNKLFVKNKYIEIALIIGLISTFSMAYFIQLTLYFLFFYIKILKNAKHVFVVALFFGFVAYYLYNSRGGDLDFYMLTFKRFEQGPNGIETNRDELAKMAEKYFYQSPVFGVGAKRIEDIEYMGDNPYELLAKDGILGYVITYFPLFFCGINYRKYPNVFWSVIILFIGYQQRPFHINLVHYVTFFTFIYACMKYKNNKLIYGR